SAVGTSVRRNPDSTTDFSFQAGAAYTVAVDTRQPNARTAFDRDFLLQKQFLLSGVAYVSGPNGQAYNPGAPPVAGATINLFDAGGTKLKSTTTGADGSYQFLVPGPGRYQLATDQQQPAQVNVPGRHDFQFNLNYTPNPYPALSLPLTT